MVCRGRHEWPWLAEVIAESDADADGRNHSTAHASRVIVPRCCATHGSTVTVAGMLFNFANSASLQLDIVQRKRYSDARAAARVHEHGPSNECDERKAVHDETARCDNGRVHAYPVHGLHVMLLWSGCTMRVRKQTERKFHRVCAPCIVARVVAPRE